MYILYEVEYPASPVAVRHVENAWTEAGLPQPVPTFGGPQVTREEIGQLVVRTLEAAGATRTSARNGDLEVPDDARPWLEKLEAFYQRLYPETMANPGRGNFHYEQLEWLGEF